MTEIALADLSDTVAKTVQFLRSVAGIRCKPRTMTADRAKNCFLRGVIVCDGGLYLDETASPSALIHEAGHLALMPADIRDRVYGARTDKHNYAADEFAVTAWAYAATVKLGLPKADAIPDQTITSGAGSYLNDLIIDVIESGIWVGAYDLASRGFTTPALYPGMRKWRLA